LCDVGDHGGDVLWAELADGHVAEPLVDDTQLLLVRGPGRDTHTVTGDVVQPPARQIA